MNGPAAPLRFPVRWLRVAVGGLGLLAVALSGGAGPLADLALLAGSAAALGAAWFPHTPAAWGVLAAALLPRLSGPGAVDAEVLAQAAVLLLFQVAAALLTLVAPARTVEVAALRPALLRCAVTLLAVLPAAAVAALLGRSGGSVPSAAAAVAATGAAVLLVLLVRPVLRISPTGPARARRTRDR